MGNPILELAEQPTRNGFSRIETRNHALALLEDGRLGSNHLHEAMQLVFDAKVPARGASVIAYICAWISDSLFQKQKTETNFAGALHFLTAESLFEHRDQIAYELAVVHYSEAMYFLAPNDPDYNRARINKAVTLCKLADFGDRPIDNLSDALGLFKSALSNPDLDPSEQHECSMGIRKASVELSRAGVLPVEMLEEAIRGSSVQAIHSQPKNLDDAEAFVNEAVACISLAGFGQQAIRNLRRADELLSFALLTIPEKTVSHGIALLNKGNVKYGLAQLDSHPIDKLTEAVDFFQRGRNQLDENQPAYLRTLENEAAARSLLAEFGSDSLHHFETALECCQEARKLRTEGSMPIPGHLLVNEGVILSRMVDTAANQVDTARRALQLFQQATTLLSPSNPDWGVAKRNEGRLLSRLGSLESAHQSFGQGLRCFENLRGQMLREHERTAFWESIVHEYAEMVELCLELANSDESSSNELSTRWYDETWHWVHRAKSRSLLEVLAGDRLQLSTAAHMLHSEVRLHSRQLDKLERAFRFRSLDTTPSDELKSQHETIRSQLLESRDRLLREVAPITTSNEIDVPPVIEVIGHLRVLATSPRGQHQQQVSTDEKCLLVEFFMLDPRRLLVFLVPLWDGAQPVTRLLTLQGPTIVELAGSLSDTLTKLQSSTRARVIGVPSMYSESDQQNARNRLTRLPEMLSELVEPWSDLLRLWQPTELLLSPHHFTNLLPIHAANFDGQPLIEHFPVAYIPSASLAREMCHPLQSSLTGGLLIGNPTLDLKGAEVEVLNVSRWLQDGGISHHTLLGLEASTESVTTKSATASIVHFAGHSVLDQSDFFRSGLEMADSRLTALDMRMTFDLRHTKLVYLSSCDSGQAIPGRTDDLMGLARVFLSAGCRTTIASLWAVDDGAACSFADYFYQSCIGDSQTIGVSLRNAILALKKDLPNPFYWAPFVVLGVWNTQLTQKVPTPNATGNSG